MCTLIVLDRIAPGYPLVLASNRDEYYSRPAAPPARVDPQQDGGLPFVAPQDLEEGGTWMGVNAFGLFVGLTNRAVRSRRDGARSRGLLVREALAQSSAAAVAEQMTENGAGLSERYNPFHLVMADGRESYLTVVAEDRPATTRRLGPGIHVVCNRDPDDPGSGKAKAIRGSLQALDLERPITEVRDTLAGVLSGHPDPSNPLENPCVHTPEYGTRSSTVLALGVERWRYWHAEGPPCETKYGNFTRLLDQIREAPPVRIT